MCQCKLIIHDNIAKLGIDDCVKIDYNLVFQMNYCLLLMVKDAYTNCGKKTKVQDLETT